MKTNISNVIVPNLEGARVIGNLSARDYSNGGRFLEIVVFDNGYVLEHGADPFQDAFWRYSTVCEARERLDTSKIGF